jgi:hypothetical protein
MADMKTFECLVDVGGRTRPVQVTAENGNDAISIIEAQYGKENRKGLPTPKD